MNKEALHKAGSEERKNFGVHVAYVQGDKISPLVLAHFFVARGVPLVIKHRYRFPGGKIAPHAVDLFASSHEHRDLFTRVAESEEYSVMSRSIDGDGSHLKVQEPDWTNLEGVEVLSFDSDLTKLHEVVPVQNGSIAHTPEEDDMTILIMGNELEELMKRLDGIVGPVIDKELKKLTSRSI